MDIEVFLNIEKKYNLYEQSIDGVQYWSYARFSIWNYQICSARLGLEESHKKKENSMGKNFQLAAGLVYNSIFKRKIPRKNVDLLFLNHERRVKNQQYYECAYTEKLSEYYTNSVTLEKPYEYRHFKPVRTNNLVYTDYIMVKGNLYYRINKICKTKEYKRLYHLVEEQMKKPLGEMKEAYSWKADNHKIYNLLVEKIMQYKKEYKEYDKLLKKVNPKVIVEVVHYCMQNMIINEIAKKRRIPTIELQHGTIYPEHAAYQYAKGAKVVQLPDEIFLFSDFWGQGMQVPIEDNKLIATGYPLFEEKIEAYGNVSKESARKTILFVSQGTIGVYLSKLAAEIAEVLPIEKYRIIYKLHPAEYQTWKESYPCLQSGKIEVIDHNSKSIYEYFAMSDMQIGVYSTAIYEGVGFGLQTLILRVGHYDIMQSLVDSGYAEYVDCVEDVVEYIRNNHQKKMEGNQFWKQNALQNMEDEIDKLLFTKEKQSCTRRE